MRIDEPRAITEGDQMAWYTIRRDCCGAVERIQVYGPSDTRQARANRTEMRPCQACARQRRAVEAEQAAHQAAGQADLDGLPTLTGTDRQVAWALVLRDNTIKRAPSLATMPGATGDHLDWLLDRICERTDAAWWIDHRAGLPRDDHCWTALRTSLTDEQKAEFAALGKESRL
ncbi:MULTISPECIES: hypothetical protein [Frankiaceae]|nr:MULTISPECIES: hypothetical protein [Frankiaceae]